MRAWDRPVKNNDRTESLDEELSLLQQPRSSEKVHLGMKTHTAIISIKDLNAEAIPKLNAAFTAVPGVQSVDFSMERSVAVVEFDGEHSKVDDLLRAVLKAGYQVQ